MDYAAAVDLLYGSAPEGFVAQRKEVAAQARAAGDRALATRILALRKPTVAAGVLNALVRARPPELDALLGYAEEMRAAQAAADGPLMRRLGREREDLLTSLGRRVAWVAAQQGISLTAAVLDQTRATFVAVIADEAAEREVLGGCLVRALTYAGLGPVDLTEASAAPHDEIAAAGDAGLRARGRPERSIGERSDSGSETGRSDATAPDRRTREQTSDQAAQQAAAQHAEQAAERAAARQRLLARARDRLAEAEREVTARSLERADATDQADRAAARLAELQTLLQRAAADAEAARAAADDAADALAGAEQSRRDAAAEVTALEA